MAVALLALCSSVICGQQGHTPAPCDPENKDIPARMQYHGDLKTDPSLQDLLRETEESGDIYLLVDVDKRRLYVKRGTETLRECVISAGSGRVLTSGTREWIFQTPRGMFPVLNRERNPIWIRPDWEYVEKGLKPPPEHSPKRIARGELGKYALDLGYGYKIHGTPHVRQLGRNVTHGCIRVGARDLKYIWDHTDLCTRVFIQ